jgi:hypothetical protein
MTLVAVICLVVRFEGGVVDIFENNKSSVMRYFSISDVPNHIRPCCFARAY